MRIWSALRGAQMDFSIYENKLAITSLGEKPFVVVIESADIVAALRPIFDVVWGNAKEIK
ncbi:MAG: hypothetical protein AAB794_01690 [Patescibacteria group bacterium]